ncbi:MAG: hypothetical protein JWO46_562 [Nocardioidaceae bacterium]|nr:hypothetical protein [Nocardioidaceae bacterium]
MRVLRRLAAAVQLTAAAGAVAPLAPASAAACSSADGVTVVVDFHELGGGVQQVCDSGGAGKSAATQFTESGFTLTRVQRQPGFVCRVNGAPSEDPCVNTPPADAYWGLWWSDGTSGSWTYASQGVDSLKVPEGGYVALSWNGSATKSPPGAAPAPHAAEPTASPTPHPTPSGGGSHPSATPTGPVQSASPGGVTPSASASETPSDGPSGRPAHRGKKHGGGAHSAKPSATPRATDQAEATQSPSPAASAASDPADPGDGGLPGWVAPAGIALLFGAAAAIAVRRSRGSTTP